MSTKPPLSEGKRSPTASAHAKKVEVVVAAAKLFERRGYHGVSMEEVGEAAGLAKPTLYHYFPSKAELFQEAVRSRVGRIVAGLSIAAAPGANS